MIIQFVSTESSFSISPGGENSFARGTAVVFFSTRNGLPSQIEVSSDASGALGYGALFQHHWFSGSWLVSQASQSIEHKELFPTVVVAYVWGPFWSSNRVNFLSDNSSVVEILRFHYLKGPEHNGFGSLPLSPSSTSLLFFHSLLS